MRLLIAFCSVALLLSGCGSSGSDYPAPAGTDLSGVWKASDVAPGAPALKASYKPTMLTIVHSGTTVTGRTNMFGFTGTFDGTNINCTGTMNTATITLTFVVADDNTFGGTVSVDTGGPAPTVYQLTFSKEGNATGSLSFNGSMDGTDISLSSTTAFALQQEGSTSGRTLLHIDNSRIVNITLGTLNALTTGTYAITNNSPLGANEAAFLLSHAEGTGDMYGNTASGGTLTITSITNDTISGTFNVTGWVSGTGSLTAGSFDVTTLVTVER